jgi:hypothetical protein
MDKELIFRILIFIGAFGISDTLIEYYQLNVKQKFILYISATILALSL